MVLRHGWCISVGTHAHGCKIFSRESLIPLTQQPRDPRQRGSAAAAASDRASCLLPPSTLSAAGLGHCGPRPASCASACSGGNTSAAHSRTLMPDADLLVSSAGSSCHNGGETAAMPLTGGGSGVPVFVMLPLDTLLDSPAMPAAEFDAALVALAAAGAAGVMLDVWWGLCEPSPGVYDFSRVIALATRCADLGLAVQATMSFHQCGGNIGDSVTIPLPDWVLTAATREGLLFTDAAGWANPECLSLAADHVAFLPSAKGDDDAPRTAVQAYAAYVQAFVDVTAELITAGVITELQVGLGPCGELRYPSYPAGGGGWVFPGIGEFVCHDTRMRASLAAAAADGGHPSDWGVPPTDAGSYNDTPWAAPFFHRFGGWRSPRGRFFLTWYADALLRHGDDVLLAIRGVVPAGGRLALAVKVSGIHWWRMTASRAAEATSGYVSLPRDGWFGLTGGGAVDAYARLATLFHRHGVVFDFTCLEMWTWAQPVWAARCEPERLVRDAVDAAAAAGVPFAGENALERYDEAAYRQVEKAFKRVPAEGRYGFTLLRLGPALREAPHWAEFCAFVKRMRALA